MPLSDLHLFLSLCDNVKLGWYTCSFIC